MGATKEILFAQRLADNEKRVRDRALKKLRSYLSIKSIGPGLSEEECQKLWKGLFYCMYMADKPLVQESVAEEVSRLVHSLHTPHSRTAFTRAAFSTFAREWNGIDVFRMDKFMMLVRRVLRQVLAQLRDGGWIMKEVAEVMRVLEECVVSPDDHLHSIPLGLKLHLADIIMEELAKVGGSALPHPVLTTVLQPFIKVMALSKSDTYCQRVSQRVVRHLMQQSSLGVQYEEGGLLQGEEGHSSEEEEEEEEEAEEEEEGGQEEVLDPRAGHVDVVIPQLSPDFELLADFLQGVGSAPKICQSNRTKIYQLVGELRDMTKGYYPLALPPETRMIPRAALSQPVDQQQDSDVDISDTEVAKAVARLQRFKKGKKVGKANEDDALLMPASKKLKKRHMKKIKKRKIKENKGLTKKEKKQLNRKQRTLAQKRKAIVEKTVRQVCPMNHVSSTATEGMPAAKPTPATKEAPAAQPKSGPVMQQFTVMDTPKKKLSAGKTQNCQVIGFNVETDKGESTLKKRKKIKASDSERKKLKLGFSVTAQTGGGAGPAVTSPGQQQPPPCLHSPAPATPHNKKQLNKANQMTNPVKQLKDMPTAKQQLSIPVSSQSPAKQQLSTPVSSQPPAKQQVSTVSSKPQTKQVSTPVSSQPSAKQQVSTPVSSKPQTKQQVSTPVSSQPPAKQQMSTPVSSKPQTKQQISTPVSSQPPAKQQMSTPVSTKLSTPNTAAQHMNSVNGTASSVTAEPQPSKEAGSQASKKSGTKQQSSSASEYEIFIKKKREKMREKKKSLSKKTKLQGKKMNRSRSISINLKQNKTHEYSDYARTLRASPHIPYSADSRPKSSVLKPSPSPILVRRPPAPRILASPKQLQKVRKGNKKSQKKKKMTVIERRAKAADFF